MTRGKALMLAGMVLAGALTQVKPSPARHAAPSATPATPAISTALVLGETPGDVPVSLLIQHEGEEADRLLGGSTPIARRVELHHAPLDRGVREMVLASGGLALPGGETIVLEPEGDHLMLIGLSRDLVQGQTFPLTLHFARAEEVTLTVRVRRRVDAAGITPVPPVSAGELMLSLASAPPASAVDATPIVVGG